MNSIEAGIGSTSALGSFPGGTTPYGNEEMSGNVMEWTRSIYGDYPYPQPGIERQQREYLFQQPEYLLKKDLLVLRGGAATPLIVGESRCARRIMCNSGIPIGGFRVVVSPFL
jgi:formylglycine-generating enzyme required for sulfatase activity